MASRLIIAVTTRLMSRSAEMAAMETVVAPFSLKVRRVVNMVKEQWCRYACRELQIWEDRMEAHRRGIEGRIGERKDLLCLGYCSLQKQYWRTTELIQQAALPRFSVFLLCFDR